MLVALALIAFGIVYMLNQAAEAQFRVARQVLKMSDDAFGPSGDFTVRLKNNNAKHGVPAKDGNVKETPNTTLSQLHEDTRRAQLKLKATATTPTPAPIEVRKAIPVDSAP